MRSCCSWPKCDASSSTVQFQASTPKPQLLSSRFPSNPVRQLWRILIKLPCSSRRIMSPSTKRRAADDSDQDQKVPVKSSKKTKHNVTADGEDDDGNPFWEVSCNLRLLRHLRSSSFVLWANSAYHSSQTSDAWECRNSRTCA